MNPIEIMTNKVTPVEDVLKSTKKSATYESAFSISNNTKIIDMTTRNFRSRFEKEKKDEDWKLAI